uniref:Zgc:123010 n=1 Tax=Poecilia reticulata TaxID=8081 RepID=A0A3P9Q486_POERE
MDCVAATSDPCHDATLSQVCHPDQNCFDSKSYAIMCRAKLLCVFVCVFAQNALNEEDDLSEEDKFFFLSQKMSDLRAVWFFCVLQEPEWDVSSAFFANAASHIKPKGSSRKSKENKENEARKELFAILCLTEKGIKLVQEGQYAQAACMFTEAIKCDPKDYRFFGNRSYCYYCLEQYPQALGDAERSIELAPEWAKGYFRKGRALIGMKRYSEAEKAMEQVLKLDKNCEEAVNDLFSCKVLQLMEFGFEEMQSVALLERFSSVSPCPSLWVGNVTTEITEKHLWDLFKTYGDIESIRVLHERFCAFVNFRNADMAARAMEKLNGYYIENTRLVVRYPDRLVDVLPCDLFLCIFSLHILSPRRRGPVNGDECYFWRTTGCHFGDKCHYKHFPDQKGKDRKPWQP